MKTHPTHVRESDLYPAIYERFYRPVHFFLADRMEDAEVAGELAQEVFLKLHRFFDRIRIAPGVSTVEDQVESLAGWIFTVARNIHLDWWRGNKLEKEKVRPIEQGEEFEANNRPCISEVTERRQDLERWLSSLKPDHREAVGLWVFRGHSLEEISEKMGVSLSAVKGWMHHLRKQASPDLAC